MPEYLTEREIEVLHYAACGYSNHKIAAAMEISEQTVKNHVTHILRKMNAPDRTAAVVLGLQHGYLHLDKMQVLTRRSYGSNLEA